MMTSKLGTTVVVAIGALLAACSGSTKGGGVDDGVRESNDALSASCFQNISAPAGSAEWRQQLDACLAEARAAAQGSSSGGGAQSCSISVSCVNGSCVCSGGGNANKPCDGSKTTGADACSVVCQSCGGGSAPPPAAPPGGSADGEDGADDPGTGGTACSVSTQCLNGACTCSGGPNKGQSCDGTTVTGANSCSVKCQYCQ